MFNKELNKRRLLLEKLIEKVKKELPDLPEGNLRIQRKGKIPQYFHVTEKGDSHGSFIRSDSIDLVRKLARRTYYEKLLREAERECKAISAYLRCTGGKTPEEVYSEMNQYRKELVQPLLMSDEDFAKRWENEPYQRNPYHPEECIHPTDKGDLVRSKSEARIADMYFALGIPYRYEAPLKLKNGKTKYPDFTLLKTPERTRYYHEHMGIMEDDAYRAGNLKKLSEYAESGIFTGKNLILTFEADYAPLNIKELRNNVRQVFLT